MKTLLSPEKVDSLIVLPKGCLEQTMTKLAPTASAIRYLDLSNQWFNLPAGARDEALDKLEEGWNTHIITLKLAMFLEANEAKRVGRSEQLVHLI